MKYLQYRWKQRLLIVLLVSITMSILMMGLELTDWAVNINQTGYSHGDNDTKPNIPPILMYVLPFIKEIILIGVPLFLTLIWIKIVNKIKRMSSHNKTKHG
ncbi:hypothetical protein [uncultured Psychrosphaera sp.]|uniref:hypothetical protein n=1 Tax=uncultured Psychrosphaera sp. TaxID=1403522 RepID=UPI0030FB1EC3